MGHADFWYSDEQLHFPAVRILHLKGSNICLVEYQIKIIRKCTELKEHWDIQHRDSHNAFDVSELFKTHCSSVERLRLRFRDSVTDVVLSQILDNCRIVTDFITVPSPFGELSFRSLVRYFAHVQVLDLRRSALTSRMTQQILSNCPNLTVFRGTTLKARDILGIVEENEAGGATMHRQPQEWVCTSLRTLSIFISGLEGKPRIGIEGCFNKSPRWRC